MTKTVFITQKLPPSLLDCGIAPAVPVATLQSQVADYLVRLWEWGQGCSDDVAAIKSAVAVGP
ncbi:MAG: hypothetical protein POG74_12840 [Acidocella sp.]|nr:hypothetical protein [Acidocella sp.]